MLNSQSQYNRYVVCIENTGYEASLELRKIYLLVPDNDAASDGDYRVVDESGEDYLYPASYFVSLTLPSTVEKAILQAH